MFKRVEKRRRKKEEEEELGLDEDMKEVLGMQDTDSDESESEPESESDSDSDHENGSDAGIKEATEEVGGTEKEDGDGEDSETGNPEISVEDALEDPVYLISLEPDRKACIVCPGKLLRHPRMIEIHKTSNAHRRRFTRFVELARNASPGDNAWDVLQRDGTAKTKEDKRSRRKEKRKKKLAVIKAKRERRKEMKAQAKAKQKEKAADVKAAASAAASSSHSPDKSQVEEPAKKKRKLDQDGKSKRKQHQPPPSISRGHGEKGSRTKVSAEGHKRGKLAGKKGKSKPKGEHKQKRHSGGDSVLKIID